MLIREPSGTGRMYHYARLMVSTWSDGLQLSLPIIVASITMRIWNWNNWILQWRGPLNDPTMNIWECNIRGQRREEGCWKTRHGEWRVARVFKTVEGKVVIWGDWSGIDQQNDFEGGGLRSKNKIKCVLGPRSGIYRYHPIDGIWDCPIFNRVLGIYQELRGFWTNIWTNTWFVLHNSTSIPSTVVP